MKNFQDMPLTELQVAQIRLVESEAEELARTLRIDLTALYNDRFEWFFKIFKEFQKIQAEFFVATGSTLSRAGGARIGTGGSDKRWDGIGTRDGNPGAQSVSAGGSNGYGGGAGSAAGAENEKEYKGAFDELDHCNAIMETSVPARHNQVLRRKICAYLAPSDLNALTMSAPSIWLPQIVWSWYARFHAANSPFDSRPVGRIQLWHFFLGSSFVSRRLRAGWLVERSTPQVAVLRLS